MSNYLAIANVTATLGQLLQSAATAAVPGAAITTSAPGSSANGMPARGINIFLYQVTPNPAFRNADLPTRREDGALAQRPQAALDLHYLLSFYGDDQSLEPQRLLGSAVSALHARPLLTRDQLQAAIDAALAADPAHFLGLSNLPQQVELVKFTPLPMTLDELSRLWSVFFQTPYALSVAYVGSLVLIESEETPQAALPVLGRNFYGVPFRQPVIEQVKEEGGAGQPILFGSTVILTGKGLLGDTTLVRIGDSEVTPDEVTDTRITVVLSVPPFAAGDLRAGVRAIQVVHSMPMGTPLVAHRGIESNMAPFILRPAITPAGVANVQGVDPAARSADITVDVAPAIGPAQRVVLLLNELTNVSPSAYAFYADPITMETASLTISVTDVKAAEYLVRVQVDGAESPLDLDPASPDFGPTVTIP